MHTEGLLGRNVPGYVETPTGFASFAKDNFTPPEEWVRRCYNLQRFTEFDRGGAGVSGGPRGRDPWVVPSAPLLINNSPISGSSTNHLAQDG